MWAQKEERKIEKKKPSFFGISDDIFFSSG
jgi:hypothetical protein